MNRLTILLLFIPSIVLGSAFGDVTIDEIIWMGTEVSANDEWIKLKNNTDKNINLNNWILKADDGSPKITLEGIIISKNTYLLERTNDDSNPDEIADIIYTGALNNSGENLRLYDDLGNIVAEVLKADGWENKEVPEARPREESATDQPAEAELPQEINAVSDTLPIIYPKGIIFSEIMPAPEGPDAENEWIKIYNQNSFEVDLFNWTIEDKIGRTKIYTINQKIKAFSSLILTRPETKITLNNNGDGLILFNPNKEVVDFVSFGNAQKDQSYILINGSWQWTTTNIPKETKEIETITSQYKDIKRIELDQESKVPIIIIGFIIALASSIIFLIIKSNLKRFWY